MALTFPQMPAWLVADKPTWAQQSEQTQSVFNMAYQNAAQNKRQDNQEMQQRNMLLFRKNLQDQEDTITAQKFSGIADKLKGADTPEAAWNIVSQNPQWLADPRTSPGVQNYLKAQTEVARAEVNSIQGKTAIADMTEFTKRLATVLPGDRAMITGLSKNPNGTPSPDQWQALGNAETKLKTDQEIINEKAKIEALQRGDVVTTTVTDKGVSQKFAPPSASGQPVKPEEMTLSDGSKIVYNPKTGAFKFNATKSGVEKDLTAPQLLGIAKHLETVDPDDPNAKKIMQFLSDKAAHQAEGSVKIPIDPNRPRLQNPDGSVSTEKTITVESDGKHYLLRTIVDGKRLSNDEAIKLWRAGKNKEVAVFDNAKDAEDYAIQRSKQIGDTIQSGSTKSGLKYNIVPLK